MRRKFNVLLQVTRGLCRLFKAGRLSWLINYAESRAYYELDALYSGIVMNRAGRGDVYNLRRNVHRIEKGLIQKRPKPVFAEDYIHETVKALIQSKESGACDKNTLIWAQSVLSQYFLVCNRTAKVNEAFVLFEQLCPDDTSGFAWHPYPAKLRPDPGVSYNALHQLAIRRRSVRHYLPRLVEPEIVKKAMEVAALSPGACNRQSFQFFFYNRKEIVDMICAIPGGYNGFEAPSIVIVVGKYRGYFDERDANVPVIDASLSTMAFILALETLGLSSVCINWPLLPDKDKALRKLIRLDDDEFVVMLIGIGYADPEGKVPFSGKRDVDMLIACNDRVRS